MTLTVLMHDAMSSLGESSTTAYQRGDLADMSVDLKIFVMDGPPV